MCNLQISGSAADTQYLTSIVQTELVSRRVLHNVRGTVTHAASLLRALLLTTTTDSTNNNDNIMSASLVCAGYDHELRRGVIYTIGKGGIMFEEQYYACGGSGSTYIIGHLDSYYNTRRPRHASYHHHHRRCAVSVVATVAAAKINNDNVKDNNDDDNVVYKDYAEDSLPS